jgi:hypothetical protein
VQVKRLHDDLRAAKRKYSDIVSEKKKFIDITERVELENKSAERNLAKVRVYV